MSKNSSTGADGWEFSPALTSLATVASLALVCQLPGTVSILMIPIALLVYAAASIIVFGMTVLRVVQKRPRRGASIFLILLLPVILWLPINRAADFVHLGLTALFGAGQLGEPSISIDGKFIAYDWSVGLAGGLNTFLIYDATDEVTLPLAKQTKPSGLPNELSEECSGRAQRLLSHYYVCSF
jgi:hypothetical protein